MQVDTLISLGFDNSTLDEETGFVHVECSQCAALVINGTPCHERGCPNHPVECRECGSMHPDHGSAAACCSEEYNCESDEDIGNE